MSGVPIVAVKIEYYCFNHSERAPRYLKVFLSATGEDDDPNIFGLDVMICSSDYERLQDFQSLQPLKPYEFRTKVMSGSKQRISIKILGIKKPALEKAVK